MRPSSAFAALAARTDTGQLLPALGGEAERRHVAVLHHVVAALHAQEGPLARGVVAADLPPLVPRHDLRPHQAAPAVGVHLTRCAAGSGAARDRPGPRLLALARREVRDQLEQRERLAYHGLEAGLLHPELLAHGRGLLVLELAELGVEPRAHRRGARPAPAPRPDGLRRRPPAATPPA